MFCIWINADHWYICLPHNIPPIAVRFLRIHIHKLHTVFITALKIVESRSTWNPGARLPQSLDPSGILFFHQTTQRIVFRYFPTRPRSVSPTKVPRFFPLFVSNQKNKNRLLCAAAAATTTDNKRRIPKSSFVFWCWWKTKIHPRTHSQKVKTKTNTRWRNWNDDDRRPRLNFKRFQILSTNRHNRSTRISAAYTFFQLPESTCQWNWHNVWLAG